MVIFRADVSPRTGLRSLRRCAYLAALLKKNGGALLCCREDKKAAKFLVERDLPVRFLKDPSTLDLAGAQAILFDLDDFSPADKALLENARQAGIKSIQVLSAGGDGQPVDIQVCPFCAPGQAAMPATCHLAGAASALLHHKFRHFNTAKRKYRKKIRNIFIDLGDLLPYRDLRAIVETLHRLGYRMKIVPGLGLKKADKRNLMKIYPGSHFCGKSESTARACFEADLALIPPGDVALEAAAVGTPALFMLQEKGDIALAGTCSAQGIGVKVPALADWSVQALRDAIAPLTPELREQMGAAGKALVDGLGVQRFFQVLKENGIIN
jgi:spore coat polysaccharide biosynthesis predicted glycosyltransferase SpsG